jgi:hypothetical protein
MCISCTEPNRTEAHRTEPCSLGTWCTRLSFNNTLRGRSQVKDIASRSGLEKSNLRTLWSLADTGVKGRLTFAEFGLLLGVSFVCLSTLICFYLCCLFVWVFVGHWLKKSPENERKGRC